MIAEFHERGPPLRTNAMRTEGYRMGKLAFSSL